MKTTRSPERVLAVLGVVICVGVVARVWDVIGRQQPLLPLPGLYLLELIVASLASLVGIFQAEAKQSAVIDALSWIASGVFMAFVMMGAWSIGFLFLPVTLICVTAAIRVDRRLHRNLLGHIGIAILAAVGQAAFMLVAIRLLDPAAVF